MNGNRYNQAMQDPTRDVMRLRETRTLIESSRSSQGVFLSLILTATTLAALTVVQEPVGWTALSWIALVPWILATTRTRRGGQMGLVSYGLGVVYYAVNLSWLYPVELWGTIGLCFYLAVYFPLCGFILRRIYLNRRWPFLLVVPVVWVGQEFLRAWVFTGFPWFFLSHSLHDSEKLIQLADLCGAYGLTFLIAMVNGLICDLLLRPLVSHPTKKGKHNYGVLKRILITCLCIAVAWTYGLYRLSEGDHTIKPGPIVSVIQERFPQFVKDDRDMTERIFKSHLTLSLDALASDPKPDLIVWPETMVTSPINPAFIDSNFYQPELQKRIVRSQGFSRQLAELSGQGTNVLVGTSSERWEIEGDYIVPVWTANSAVYYTADGQPHEPLYHKMHRVPFGEFVPFKQSAPWLHRLFLYLTPYGGQDYSITAGDEPVAFPLQTGENEYQFGVAICYEDIIPWVPRVLAARVEGRKRVDFLLNISNEGWYVRGESEEDIQTTAELPQHLAIARFRAVENRVGIARSVNMGISGFIKPDGTVQQGGLASSLPDAPLDRQNVAGFVTDHVYIDSRVTIYNQTGDLFALICVAGVALLFLDALMIQWKLRKRKR
jgi:apolipoprotein N-acyltransferase